MNRSGQRLHPPYPPPPPAAARKCRAQGRDGESPSNREVSGRSCGLFTEDPSSFIFLQRSKAPTPLLYQQAFASLCNLDLPGLVWGHAGLKTHLGMRGFCQVCKDHVRGSR